MPYTDTLTIRGEALPIIPAPIHEHWSETARGKGFEIVGVSLDADKAAVESFLKDSPLPWSIIHEPGGMDSRLADEFGIISLPTMILTDASGKVVNRNIRTAAELDRMLERMFATAGGGTSVTLGGNAAAEPR